MHVANIVLVQVDFDRSATHPKFDPTRVQTHNIQIMESTFHVHEVLALTTKPSGTHKKHFWGIFGSSAT